MTLPLRARLAVVLRARVRAAAQRAERRLVRRARAAARRRRDHAAHGADRRTPRLPAIRDRARRPSNTTAPTADQAAFVQEATRFYQIYDVASGRLLVQSDGLAPHGAARSRRSRCAPYRAQPQPFDVTTSTDGSASRTARSATGRDASICVQVGVSLDTMDNALSRYRDLLLWLLPAALARRGARRRGGSRASRSRPLTRPGRAPRATIDVRTLERRVPTRGVHDELDDVAMAFNDTLARSSTRSARCGSSAPRSPTSCARRSPRCAARSSWPCGPIGPRRSRAARRWPARSKSSIDSTRLIDQILTLARAESGQIPSDVRGRWTSASWRHRSSSSSNQLRRRADRSALRAQRAVLVNGDAGWLRAAAAEPARQRDQIHAAKAARVVVARVARSRRARGSTCATRASACRPTSYRTSSSGSSRPTRRGRRASDGAGVGLSLVKWIVDRHEGTIAVQSRAGEGSTFTVRLP